MPRGFGGEQHREAACGRLVAGSVRTSMRHQIGAGGVGDPGLVAGDAVVVAVADRAGPQRAEVGAGVGLGEDRGRQDLARGDAAAASRPSAPRCRRRGSARRRSPSGCRASPRRCSRATAPRRRRTSRSWTGRRRRIPPGWSGRTRRARPSPRRSRSGSARRAGASRGRCGTTRSSAKRRNWSRIISYSSSRPVAPKLAAPPPARISATRRARAASLLPSAISAATAAVRKAASARVRGRASPGRTISTCDIGMPPASWRQVFAEADLQDQPLGLAEASRGLVERAGPSPRARAGLGIGRHPGQAVGGELIGLERRVRDPPRLVSRRREAVAGGGDQPRGGFGGRGAAGQERRTIGGGAGASRGRLRSLAVSSRALIVRRGIGCCGCAEAKGKFGSVKRARKIPSTHSDSPQLS